MFPRRISLLLCSFIFQFAFGCGDVSIANMNWPSASFIAHLDKYILETAFGCQVSLVPGDTEVTTQSLLANATPDIAPELWVSGSAALIEQAYVDKTLRPAAKVLTDGGEEGFWVPTYMVDQNSELQSIAGVKKLVELFKVDGVASFYGCPQGWYCRRTTRNLFRALGLGEAGFTLVEPKDDADMVAIIEQAYKAKAPWFGYYWAPTEVLGRYPMVKVNFGSGVNLEHFQNCIAAEVCKDPKPTMYPNSPVYSVVSEQFAKNNPAVFEYLQQRKFTNLQMNNLLASMTGDLEWVDADTQWFLLNYALMWSRWLPRDKAELVWNSLQ